MAGQAWPHHLVVLCFIVSCADLLSVVESGSALSLSGVWCLVFDVWQCCDASYVMLLFAL